MGAEEIQTEKLIKEKAKILFFQKGFLNATTQEIADEAGVNRALIHYYFRSRELMLDTLLDETLKEKKGTYAVDTVPRPSVSREDCVIY